jgi:hypothetical protein
VKTFTIIYHQQPFSGPSDYFRATVEAPDVKQAFEKFREQHPVYEEDEAADEDDEATDLPERIEIVCAFEGDLEAFWCYD